MKTLDTKAIQEDFDAINYFLEDILIKVDEKYQEYTVWLEECEEEIKKWGLK